MSESRRTSKTPVFGLYLTGVFEDMSRVGMIRISSQQPLYYEVQNNFSMDYGSIRHPNWLNTKTVVTISIWFVKKR